ncbi:MAG: response regulator transcription factor [Ginsengibacter sp.]
MANVVLVDDHVLLRNGLANLIESFADYKVLFQADNGKDFTEKLNSKVLPEIVLMDINMPEMDGYETCMWLKYNQPDVKVLALSMYDNENSIIKMFQAGAKGYILKDSDPSVLKAAMYDILTKGFYYSEMVTGKLIRKINESDDRDKKSASLNKLKENEITFLKLVCSELTYKEIADKMFLSPRTIDGYRDDLFQKLNVKTRVGLVMFAIKHGLVNL